MIAAATVLPVLLAFVDVILRSVVAKITGEVSIRIADLSNKIMWIELPDSNAYFYTERLVTSDKLWLLAILFMAFLFFG